MSKEENKISITKAKLDKELILEVDYTEQTHEGPINHSIKGASAVHDDLRLAFKELVPHAAKLCEVYNKDGELDTERMVLRGISISTGSNPGYIFTFLRELSTGKKVVQNTPLLSAETDEETYPGIDELRELLGNASKEVREYVFNGKKAADIQKTIFDSDDNTEGEDN